MGHRVLLTTTVICKSTFSQILKVRRILFILPFLSDRDLSFHKGDIILLKKQVDENWYQGEAVVAAADGSTATQVGFFPASYVQVIHPLPASIPQCKALYDFDLKDENEKDCLSFNKVRTGVVSGPLSFTWGGIVSFFDETVVYQCITRHEVLGRMVLVSLLKRSLFS